MTNEQFNARIAELWAQTKVGKLPREERFKAIEALTDEYIDTRGKRPEPAQLDRLATLCLYEEVSDMNEHKMTHNEEPILSDQQQGRRYSREVSGSRADDYGTDGKQHTKPTRYRIR